MDPYIGQIMAVGFNFAPLGWSTCNGQALPIQQNTALFSLLGVTYGGDGVQTFALPNLGGAGRWGPDRARAPPLMCSAKARAAKTSR